jgi:hypothetical protein
MTSILLTIDDAVIDITALVTQITQSSYVAPKEQTVVTEPKAPKATKVRKPRDGKAVMAAIREACAERRYSDAVALAETKGWAHVVDSVHRKQDADKRRTATKSVETIARQPRTSGRKAQRDALVTQAVIDAVEAEEAPKGPAVKGRPRCAEHHVFLKGDGTCKRCLASIAPPAPKVPSVKAETVTVKTEAPKALTAADMFPGGLSESDLVLAWHAMAAKAAEGSRTQRNHMRATFESVVQVCNTKAAEAATSGSKLAAAMWAKRAKNARNVVSALVATA